MDCPISGEIISSSTKARALRRFVDKQIWSWVRTRVPDLLRADTRYHVTFDRLPGDSVLECRLQVFIGTEQWTANDFDSGPHQAFLRCLDHLTRVPGPFVRAALAPVRHAS